MTFICYAFHAEILFSLAQHSVLVLPSPLQLLRLYQPISVFFNRIVALCPPKPSEFDIA